MNPSTPWLRAAGRLILTASACAALAWVLPPWGVVVSAMSSLPWSWWCAAALALVAGHALRALRLRSEWACERAPGLGECLRVSLMHGAAVNLLPMRAGEAGYVFLLKRRWGVSVADAALSLLWLRLQDAVVLVAAALFVFSTLPLALRLAVATSLVVAAAFLLPLWARSLGQRSAGQVAQRIATAVLRGGRIGWVYGAANWALKLTILGALLSALSGLDFGVGLAAALGGELAAVSPVQAPGGLGTYEAGVWLGASGAALFGRAGGGIDTGSLVAAALLVHALVIIVAVMGAFAAWLLPMPAARRTGSLG